MEGFFPRGNGDLTVELGKGPGNIPSRECSTKVQEAFFMTSASSENELAI
jgi:hypothetical protein